MMGQYALYAATDTKVYAMTRDQLVAETSVIGSSLTVIAAALKPYGIDADEIYKRHGVELNLVSQPCYRVPVSRSKQLWAEAAVTADNDAFGLLAGSCAHPTMYHSLSMALWSSSSIKQLIECWIQHLSVISTAATAQFSGQSNYYELTINPAFNNLGNQEAGEISIDATLAALITICRLHSGTDFSPTHVELMRAAPSNTHGFEQFFNCPIKYSAETLTLRFNKKQLEKPIIQGNPQLMREMEKLSLEYILGMGGEDLIGKLRKTFLEQLPNGGADQEQVASALCMSARTLHRKLRDEGTSYREQLDEVRRELSLQYIIHGKLSVLDIAFQLGFSNCSNFARAFKRWVGKTPNEYRNDVMSPSPC